MTNPAPRSPRDKVGGLVYFGRMIDKIRLHLRGELPADYQENFGGDDVLDGLLAQFLEVEHRQIIERMAQGGSDEAILEWCCAKGHRPNAVQSKIWNAFAEKVGLHDRAAATVARVNQRLGLDGKLTTIFECIDADEGRGLPSA